MRLTIYTDGASRGNPGNASYGFVLKDEKGKLIFEEGKYLGVATNNFAEYSAILAVFLYVKANFKDNGQLVLDFFMDSKLAVEQLSGRFKVKNPVIRGFHAKIYDISKYFKSVSYKHIPRELNKEADRMANLALDSLLFLR